jgi:hypothetical protein
MIKDMARDDAAVKSWLRAEVAAGAALLQPVAL